MSKILFSLRLMGGLILLATWLTNFALSKPGINQKLVAGLIIVGSMGFGLACHWIRKDGLISGYLNVAERLAAASSIELPEISMGDLEGMLQNESNNADVVLVDCRYPSCYRQGTIGNAVNYPLNIPPEAEQQLVYDLKGSARIVLFCQSASCPYGEMIAKRLYFSGVRNLYVLNGGVHEWVERK